MKTLIVIMAHREAQETFDRHLPLWEAHGCDIVTYSPVDAPIHPRRHIGISFGTRSHHDAEANRRFKYMLNALSKTEYDRFVIFEYDAICLAAAIPMFFERTKIYSPDSEDDIPHKDFTRPYVAGNVFRDDRPDRGFQGTTFIHPPLIFTKAGLELINPYLKALPDDCEQGFWDRMLGLACENAGIEPLDFMKHCLGYAENTIIWDSRANDAAADGRIFFHGVKDPGVLTAIQAGHEEAKRTGKLRHGLEIPL